jgi:hypothetical protein
MFTQRRHSLSAPVECALLLLSLSVPALGFQVKLSRYHARPAKFFALRAIDRLSFETRSVQAIVMGSAREWPVFPPERLTCSPWLVGFRTALRTWTLAEELANRSGHAEFLPVARISSTGLLLLCPDRRPAAQTARGSRMDLRAEQTFPGREVSTMNPTSFATHRTAIEGGAL